jgi:hypothetical protein
MPGCLRRFWLMRPSVPWFSLAVIAVLLFFHIFYSARGVSPPSDGYRTPFAELGYVVRYLAGQTPERVIASRRDHQLHLFFDGEIPVQLPDAGARIGQQLAAAMRPTLDRLIAGGVHVVPVLVPTKLSIYRDELPHGLDTRSRWTAPSGGDQRENPEQIHQVIAQRIPEAIDLYEPFRAFRRTDPDRRLYLPLDYHWTSLGSAVAVLEVARVLMERGLLRTPPQWLSQGRRPSAPSTLTDLYPLPRWYLARGRDFQAQTEEVRFVTIPTDEDRRVILFGTSFSGAAPQDFLGQLRSVLGRRMESFVRPNNGYAGGFVRMKQAGLRLRRDDLVIWEIPLCCLNLEAPGIPDDISVDSRAIPQR